MLAASNWDIFCRVIDNYGDIGVCWRLAADLAARGRTVRLWVDDPLPLRWMAPGALEGSWPGVSVLRWRQSGEPDFLARLPRANVIVEGFGCEIEPVYLARHFGNGARNGERPGWINLEYMSAQGYSERCHLLPSPILQGAARGQTRHFFFPGFSAPSGGLLREPGLLERQARFDRRSWLSCLGVDEDAGQLVSLFCYEPILLPALLDRLRDGATRTQLLVTTGRAAAAVRRWMDDGATRSSRALDQFGRLTLFFLPALNQLDFDHLLWSCDLNLVRGEDSLVRALWANKPFVWQIYPQDDKAHHEKLDAVLQAIAAPASWSAFHHAWNGLSTTLPDWELPEWHAASCNARLQLLRQSDLTTRLLEFAGASSQSRPAPENR